MDRKMNDRRDEYGRYGSDNYGASGYQSGRYETGRHEDSQNHKDGQNHKEDEGAGIAAAAVGALLLGVGGYLIYRGVAKQGGSSRSNYDSSSRYGQNRNAQSGVQGNAQHVRESVTINKPASELYHYWRHLSNLSSIMSHLESVTEKTDTRSHWVARGPVGTSVEWDAEVTQDLENQLIAWKAVEDADVQNEGSVTFTEAPGGRGTEVRVNLTYHPPGGQLGAAVAKLFGEEPSQQLSDDLRRFKQRMETGVTATTQGQPSGN